MDNLKNKYNRMMIGVLGIPTYDDEAFSTSALYNEYKRMLVRKNTIPFMIPPIQDVDFLETRMEDIPELTLDEKDMYMEMLDMCSGLILPGGYLLPKYYNFIVDYALAKNMPILGTCLGMQLLACNDCGRYVLEKMETEEHKKRGEKYAHDVRIVDGTLLSNILDLNEIKVNSIHRYRVTKLNNFRVSAYAEDGTIEAIELPGKDFVLGVQWHPEKMLSYDINANLIADRFMMECVKYNEKKLNENDLIYKK